MRARSVFLGDNVKDTWHQEAEMEGLGAAVPAMEDSRTIDAPASNQVTTLGYPMLILPTCRLGSVVSLSAGPKFQRNTGFQSGMENMSIRFAV